MPLRTPCIPYRLLPLALGAALALAACGGGGGDDDDHVAERIDSAGRLALTDASSAQVRVLELDTDQTIASVNAQSASPVLYTSPGGRYALLTQGEATRVRLGPFANRAEADATMAKLSQAGLSGIVLP